MANPIADPPAIDPPKSVDALAIIKALTEVSAVLFVLTFVGGWSYLASYYRTFGLNPLELDFPPSVVSTVAIYVLYKPIWPILILGAVVSIVAFLARRLRRLEQGWVVATLVILLLLVIFAGANRGRSIADEDMVVESSSLPNVAFAARTNVGEFPCVEAATFGRYDCKLLLHSKNAYYFFLPVPGAGRGSLNLYMLPDTEVVGIHVLRGLDRNMR